MFKAAVYWFIASVLALVGAFVYFQKSLLSDMVVFISVISGVAILFLAKKAQKKMPAVQRAALFIAGLFIAALSFVNQVSSLLGAPVEFWNPPYSIGEFGVLASGLSVMYFAYLGSRPLILPAAFPALTLTIYQLYENQRLFQTDIDRLVEHIASPLLGPTTYISVQILRLLGIAATYTPDYMIEFLTREGQIMRVQIIIDCTGIWSLSAFTASLIVVSFAFRKVFTKKGLSYIAVGYAGTYAANILRVVAICVSAYLWGGSGLTDETHKHAGWIAFSGWMVIFWYFFFSRYILKKVGAEKSRQDR